MAITRLQLYNRALQICGETRLSSLSENRKPRHELDLVWDSGLTDDVLSEADWTFAMRTVQLDYDTTVTPAFGYTYAFQHPSDLMRLSAMCSDEYFRTPLTRFETEAGYWYSDTQPLYIRYVSNDSAYGGDLSLWPSKVSNYAAALMASKIILNLSSDEKKVEMIYKLLEEYKKDAKNVDAFNNPTRFMPTGRWVGSRSNGRSNDDRGSGSSLIG